MPTPTPLVFPPPAPPVFQISNATARRGAYTVFESLTFALHQGQHTAVMGPNGVGKSTLLDIAGGFLPIVRSAGGSIQWHFAQQDETSPIAARIHSRLVSPAQQARYVREGWRITGLEVVLSGFQNEVMLYGPAQEHHKTAAQQLAQTAGATHLLAMQVPALSQGQLRLLLLLRALAAKPALLLLDEPYDGLSPKARTGVSALLEQAASAGSLVCITAHRTADIPPFIVRTLSFVFDGAPKKATLVARQTPQAPQQSHTTASQTNAAVGQNIIAARHANAAHAASRANAQANPHANAQSAVALPLHDTRPLHARFATWQQQNEANSVDALAYTHTAPVLALENVDVFIQRAHVLKEISWRIQPGENWIVSGENGAGKSTLLRLLYGDEVAAYGGTIAWCGYKRPPLPVLRCHVGSVCDRLQHEYAYNLSSLEVTLSGRTGAVGVYDQPTSEQHERALAWLAFFELEHKAATPFFDLSTGLGRRVLLARAMMCAPALLLLDEPCSGLDPQSRKHYLTSLATLAHAGVQLVYISHHTGDAPNVFTHQLRLEDGQVSKSGPR